MATVLQLQGFGHHLGLETVDNDSIDSPATSLSDHDRTPRAAEHNNSELASPPLTPETQSLPARPQSFHPLSSHPAWSFPKTYTIATTYDQPITPPWSQKGSRENTPTTAVTAIPSLAQSPDFTIRSPIDNVPRTHIARPAQQIASPDDKTKLHRLLRRDSTSSRSILSLSFRNSIAPSHFLHGHDNTHASNASISSKETRRPLTAVSRTAATAAANVFCLPVPNGNHQTLCTPDGDPLSGSAPGSSDGNMPQRRKSGTWFKRPSSIFVLTSSAHPSAVNSPTAADSDSCQHTPALDVQQHTPELTHDTGSCARFSHCGTNSTSTVSSTSRALDAPPSLPPLGAFKGGVLTGGEFGGDSIFDHIC